MRRTLIGLLLVLWLGLPCSAGFNVDALKSLKLLVPESRGGMSPAISPGGDDLAFIEGGFPYDLHVLSGVVSLMNANTTVNPNKVECNYGPDVTGPSTEDAASRSIRDIDWSRDGGWLAFVGRDGRLYVDHIFDTVTKKPGEPRLLAIAGGEFNTIKVPRWSPDGKRVAYIKSGSSGSNSVCVADIASGQETVLAKDAAMVEFVWQQPWSPDGKRLVYAGGKGEAKLRMQMGSSPKASVSDTKDNQDGYLAVVAADGSGQKSTISKGPSLCPAWSPVGDKIAFASPASGSYKLAEKKYVTHVTMGLWTCDSSGRNRKAVTHGGSPSEKDASYFEAVFTKALVSEFEKQYATKLTPQQLKKLKAGKMSFDDMFEAARAIIAKETGVKPDKISFSLGDDGSPTTGDPVSQEASRKATAFMLSAFQEIVPELIVKVGKLDLWPAWSTDGKRIALVRGLPAFGSTNQLVVRDVATGKERVLAEDADIECLSWANAGRLVVKTRRLHSYEANGAEPEVRLGSGEVWLLELR